MSGVSDWFRAYGFADVYPELLIGAYPLDRGDIAMLSQLEIQRILNLVEDEEYAPGQRAEITAQLDAAGIEETRLKLTDYGRLPADAVDAAVDLVLSWLNEGRRCYVHCRAGRQRSAAVAAGVIALEEGIDIDSALSLVRRRKPSANPLPHQREDLLEWWQGRSLAGGP
jgi:atypical dual specificity phosphatase